METGFPSLRGVFPSLRGHVSPRSDEPDDGRGGARIPDHPTEGSALATIDRRAHSCVRTRPAVTTRFIAFIFIVARGVGPAPVSLPSLIGQDAPIPGPRPPPALGPRASQPPFDVAGEP